MNTLTSKNNNRGFTIVELLVVIVVIGILAAITIVAYTGITTKANTAAGQSEASAAAGKINVYNVDTAYGVPTSYGSVTGAATTASYRITGLNFTTISGNKDMAAFRPASPPNDLIDFSLCGTASAAAATSYATITVPTGVIIGYWNYSGSGSLVNTGNAIGITSGNYTNGYNITCYKVGIAEATIAVAKAIFAETGTYPATAAAINANTAVSAKMPPGVTVALVNPNTGNGTTNVKFECGTAASNALPCLNTGGRITFWDYSLGTPAVASVTYGTNAGYAVPAS